MNVALPHPPAVPRPPLWAKPAKALRDRRGSTAVEFAFVGPVLVLLLVLILAYGGYFMLAHSVQQLANDAARAAVPGLSDTERRTLASTCMTNELQSYAFLTPAAARMSVTSSGSTFSVQVTYDASSNPIWSLKGLVPMPSPLIVRGAAVQLGGF